MSYSIVEFPCTKECEAVPSEWVTDNKDACWWPPYRQLSRLKKSIANREAPVHSSWTLSDARVLGTADSYDAAQVRADRARFQSDVGTEASDDDESVTQPRKRRAVIRFGDSSSAEEDTVEQSVSARQKKKARVQPTSTDLPPPPPLPSLVISTPTEVTPTPSSSVMSVSVPHETQSTPSLSATPRSAPSVQSTPTVVATPRSVPMTAMDRHILKALEELREQNKTIITLLQRQLAHSLPQAATEELPGGLKLPVQSVQELQRLNAEVDDSDIRGTLIRILAIAGGDNVGQTTRRIMKKLMSDSVAVTYNFRGKGSKQSFAALRLKTIVCDAVRRNPATARATDNDIEAEVKNWLKFAKDRAGGRRLRYERSVAESN